MTTSTVLPLDDDDGGALPQVNLHHSQHPIPMPSIDDNPSGVVATTYHNIQPHRVNTCVPALAGVSFSLSLFWSLPSFAQYQPACLAYDANNDSVTQSPFCKAMSTTTTGPSLVR